MKLHRATVIWFSAVWWATFASQAEGAMKTDPITPTEVPLDFTVSDGSCGGVVAADLDGDGHMDFVVTAPGHIGGYRLDGKCLWHLRENVRRVGRFERKCWAARSSRTGCPGG